MAEGPKPGEILHVPTPWSRYNEKYGGIEIGVATLILGHTGEGKSSLVLALADGSAKAGVHTLLLSTEDPLQKTIDRLLSQRTGIPSKRINRKQVSTTEAQQLAAAAASFPSRLEIVAEPLGTAEASVLVREWVAEKRKKTTKPLMVIVDYLQALAGAENVEQDLAGYMQDMNALAGANNLALVVTSQVRSEAQNEAKRRWNNSKPPGQTPTGWQDFVGYFRPQMGDTEWCRRAEKKAKVVMIWFRPGKWGRDFANWEVPDDVAQLHILKANFGETGYANLKWNGETQTISE